MKKLKKITKQKQLFRELITPLYEDFNRYVFSIVRNRNMRDDVVQNSLVLAYSKIDSIQDISKFKSWLFTIGKREAVTMLETYNRTVSLDHNIIEFVPGNTYLPEEFLINQETKKEIIQIINQLNEHHRDIILLKYFAELSLGEISQILNVKYGTIRTRHMRAKSIIADKLKDSRIISNK